MKKKKTDFEAEFWSGSAKHSCLTLIDAFFGMDDLPETKALLGQVMEYSVKCEILMKNYPSVIYYFYLCMRSFLRAAYVLQFKAKKWKLNDPPEHPSKLLQGSLTDEEYCNPFLVFQKSFAAFTLAEYELFLTEIIYHSLGAHNDKPEVTIIKPYLHVTKMLDAAQIIRERGIAKTNK